MWYLDILKDVITDVAVPVALALAWAFLSELQKRGYHTTYAAAVLKAVGAGQQAAAARGETIFTPAGRTIAIREGERYLQQMVPDTAAALGIGPDDHAARVDSQIGVIAAAAAASAVATPAAVASAAKNLMEDAVSQVVGLTPVPAKSIG